MGDINIDCFAKREWSPTAETTYNMHRVDPPPQTKPQNTTIKISNINRLCLNQPAGKARVSKII